MAKHTYTPAKRNIASRSSGKYRAFAAQNAFKIGLYMFFDSNENTHTRTHINQSTVRVQRTETERYIQ